MTLYSILLLLLFILHIPIIIGTDTERKKSKGKRANHMNSTMNYAQNYAGIIRQGVLLYRAMLMPDKQTNQQKSEYYSHFPHAR